MYYLPIGPYHNNLSVYWRTNRNRHLDDDFWSWVHREWNTRLDLRVRPERWMFTDEKDMIWFMLRWS